MKRSNRPVGLLAAFAAALLAALPAAAESCPGPETGPGVALETSERRLEIPSSEIAGVEAGFDVAGQPMVMLAFCADAARDFAELTRDSIGKPLALIVEGRVLSEPVVREPILDGRVQITGAFTVEEAAALAAKLRAEGD